jgi:hypothetical protein|tara:strand:+ start:369 stop:770 length:402 start_codon:yes stop_codon:yes gene_type:complete
MDKYFYIRKQADVDNDDGIDDSVYIPVKNITGIVPIDGTSLGIFFDSVVNQAGNVAEDLNVISDFVDLTITAGYTKEVTRAIVEKINGFPHSDGVIVLADMSTTTLANATVSANVVHPQITAVNAITVASAFS